MFCPFCGAQLSADAKFCTACGQTVGSSSSGAGQTNVPPPAAPAGPFVPPTNVDVQVGKWISEGWSLISQDLVMMILVGVVFMLVSGMLPIVLQAPLTVGFHILIINKMLTGRLEFGDLFKGFNYFLPALLATLVSGLFITLGMLACIIPGLVLGAMYLFTMPLIADRRMEFWPAMQASHSVVKQNYLGFTFFFIALLLLQIVGALLCLVGLLVTVPLYYAAITVAYRDVFGIQARTPIQ